MPLRFGGREQFAALRALLLAAEFTESGVCECTGATSTYVFQSIHTRVECPAGTAAILMRCDGTTTVREMARLLVDEGLVAAAGAKAATVSVVSFFIGAGCLESDAVPTVARSGVS